MAEVLSSSPLFESITLASMPRIMKASSSSDMSVIWIDIWDSQKGSKGKMLINRSFNFGRHTATVRGTAMHPGVAQCHNFDKQWHSNKAAEGRSGRANHSNINGPSGGSQ